MNDKQAILYEFRHKETDKKILVVRILKKVELGTEEAGRQGFEILAWFPERYLAEHPELDGPEEVSYVRLIDDSDFVLPDLDGNKNIGQERNGENRTANGY